MTRRFAVVYEDTADFDIATELADRVLRDAVVYLREQNLDDYRTWLGKSHGGDKLSWNGVKHLSRDAGVRGHGHFDGVRGAADAVAARKAILYLRREFPGLDAIVLMRDRDKQPLRRFGFEQARREDHGGLPIVVGLAVPMREAWVLSGYETDDDEAELLEAVRTRLKFDPRTRSHDVPDPKRALRELTDGDPGRERRCWFDTPLPTLRDRGRDNGLADYLDDVAARLSPLFGHAA